MTRTILLVEDEPVTALREQKLLTKEGYRVRIAGTGEEAVDSVKTCPDTDLVLMDIDLGEGIDGTEAARRILDEKDIPILFLSSHTEPEIVEKTEKITSYGYVVKDSGNVVLLASIKMAFRLFDAKMREVEKEEEIRESREQLAESQRIAKLGSWELDLETNVITLSAEHQLMIGEEPVEVSMPLEEYAKKYILEEDLPLLAEKMKHARENIDNPDFTDTWEYCLKNGGEGACTTLAVSGKFKSYGVIQGVSQNITERKNVEEKLRESEEKYRLIAERTSDVIFQVDLEGRVTYCSPSAEKTFGIAPEEVIGTQFMERFPESWIPYAAENFKDVIIGGEPKNLDVVILDIENREVPIEAVLEPIFEANKVIGIQGRARDISDRKRVENELSRRANFTSALLNAIPTPVFYKDREGKYIGCNQAFAEIMGVPSEEIAGKTVYDLWPSQQAETYHVKDLELMAKPEHQVYEFQVTDKHGNIRPVIFAKDVFRDTGGEVAGLVGAFLDISELKNVEEKLRESEEKYRRLFDGASMGIFLSNNDSDILDVNERALAILGYEREELVGYHATKIIHPDDISVVPLAPNIDRVARGDHLRLKRRYLKKDGNYIPVEVTINFIEEIGLNLVMFQDITDRVSTEQALEEKTNLLQTILDTMHELVAITDLEGNYAFAGSSHSIMGYDPESLIGTNVMEYVHPEDLPVISSAFENFIRTRETARVAYRNRCRDGSYIWLETIGRFMDENRILFTSRDVSEHRKITNEISRQAETLETIFEHVPGILAIINEEGRVENINTRGVEFSGKPKGELLGQLGGEVFNCINSFDGEGCGRNPVCTDCPIRTRVEHTLVAREPVSDAEVQMTFVIQGLEEERDLMVSTVPLIVEDRERVLLTISDITDRKRFEKALHESEEKFRTIVDNTFDWETWYGADNECLYVSPSCETITGYSASEFMKNPDLLESIIHPDDRESVRRHLDFHSSTDDLSPTEFRILSREGDVRWIGHACQAVFDRHGNWRGRRGSNRDITLRKRAEIALQLSEERYRTLFEKNPAVILIINYPEGRINYANSSAEKFYGWSRDKLVEMNIVDINQLPPEKVKEEMDKAKEEKQNVFHFRHKCAPGIIREVEVYSVPMVWQNEFVLFSIVNDITEKLKAEEALQRAYEEGQALLKELQHRAKNTFSILSNMVNMEALSHESTEVREVLENIGHRIHSTSELYSLLYETGSVRHVKLDRYLDKIVESMFSLSDQIEICTDIEPISVSTRDANHLGLLVTELVTNAIKHAFPDNRDGRVSISLKGNEQGYLLEISDNGAGLPDDFDPEKTESMGMLLIQGMIDHLGGTLEYESSNEGTRWKIALKEIKPEPDAS